MQIDRALVPCLAQEGDHPLAFAEPIYAHHMRALGKLCGRFQQLRHLGARLAMLEHRQCESRLGDKEIARDKLERGACRVGAPLVVAGYDSPGALVLDQDLGAAEHMAGREEGDRDLANCDLLTVGGFVDSARRQVAEPRAHDGERLFSRKYMVVPWPGMIGMAMGNDGAPDRPGRVDIEAAGAAIEAFGVGLEPSVKAICLHFFRSVSRKSRFYQLKIEL